MKSKELLKLVIGIGLVAVVAITVPLMSGCRPATPEEVKPIKVGLPSPMTGAMAADREEMLWGATMAVEEINSAGGLLGRPLEIVEADVKESAPEDVMNAYNLLMAAGVDVNVAGYFLGPVGVHTFGKGDVPMIHWDTQQTSAQAYLDNKDEYWNILMGDDGEWVYGPHAFQTLTEVIPYEHPNKKTSLMSTDFGYSVTIAEYYKEAALEAGWEIVLDEIHPFGTTEFGVQLAKIREEEPSIIAFSTIHGAEIISFFNDFLEDPTDSIIWCQYVLNMPEFMPVMGEKANGMLGSASLGPLKRQEWIGRIVERWGREPGGVYTAVIYDGVNMWAEAVKRVGDPTDYRAVVQALIEYPYEGECGVYDFDPETHNAAYGDDFIPNHEFQVQNEELVDIIMGTTVVTPFEVPWWIER